MNAVLGLGFEDMFYWIYDLPRHGPSRSYSLSSSSRSAGLAAIFIRPLLRRLLRKQPGVNDAVGYILSFFSVIYGLLLGMLAIATYQALSDADTTVVKESMPPGKPLS